MKKIIVYVRKKSLSQVFKFNSLKDCHKNLMNY